MKIWIINPYGNLPGDGWRDYRSTLIANAFTKYGHEVVWWVSNFDHRSKIFRSESWKDIQVNEGYLIKMVPTTSYVSHISLARIRHERTYANNFRKKALANDDKPDLVILGEPALFTSDIILDVLRKKKIPFIVDILDLWPELFDIFLPKKISALGRFIFAPLYWKRSRLFRKADGIVGTTKDYLKIGVSKNTTPNKEVIYLGININKNKVVDNKEANKLNISKVKGELWIVYAGTLGNAYDIPTIVKCSQKIYELKLPIKIFLAGEGPLKSLVEETIKSKNSVLVYLGKLSASCLDLFYKQCDLALSCYVKKSTVSMPVKAFDYFAAGLPIINSLDRDIGEYIVNYNVGMQYIAENADDMLRVIRQLSEDKVLRNQMRKNTLELAKIFDSSIQYEKFVILAENIIKIKKTLKYEA